MLRISMMVVQALVVAVERSGVDRARLLGEAGLLQLPLDDVQARIPLDQYRLLVRAAYELSGDPAFGLHMGERLAMGSFDVLGHLTEHTSSLREALELVIRYVRIVTEAPPVELRELEDVATIVLHLPERDTRESRLAAEFSLVGLLRMVRNFTDPHALPLGVHFTHPEPAHIAEYRRLFGARTQFSSDTTAMEVPRAWLGRKTSFRETALRDALVTRAELLLAKSDQHASARVRVERWLKAQPDLARPTLERVARDLGTTARSLRRHLSEEQVQFSALLEAARAEQARQMLLTDRRSLKEIACALGFRTPSAFSRAFKRWTGLTPKIYRAAR